MKKALISMGYRQMTPGVYGKPIGFNLFMYEEKTKEWTNWFSGPSKEMHRWSTSEFEEKEDPLDFLKKAESYSRLSHTPATFEFLSIIETYGVFEHW